MAPQTPKRPRKSRSRQKRRSSPPSNRSPNVSPPPSPALTRAAKKKAAMLRAAQGLPPLVSPKKNPRFFLDPDPPKGVRSAIRNPFSCIQKKRAQSTPAPSKPAKKTAKNTKRQPAPKNVPKAAPKKAAPKKDTTNGSRRNVVANIINEEDEEPGNREDEEEANEDYDHGELRNRQPTRAQDSQRTRRATTAPAPSARENTQRQTRRIYVSPPRGGRRHRSGAIYHYEPLEIGPEFRNRFETDVRVSPPIQDRLQTQPTQTVSNSRSRSTRRQQNPSNSRRPRQSSRR